MYVIYIIKEEGKEGTLTGVGATIEEWIRRSSDG